MWKRYFKFIKLRPGRVVTQQFGELDFSSDKIPLETIKALYENDFPYLEITPEGKELYGVSTELFIEAEEAEEQTEETIAEEIPESEVVENSEEKPKRPIRKKK
ncbi:MAG: hypothetical protein WCK18_18925 [Prolixibacteraceae bacterium]